MVGLFWSSWSSFGTFGPVRSFGSFGPVTLFGSFGPVGSSGLFGPVGPVGPFWAPRSPGKGTLGPKPLEFLPAFPAFKGADYNVHRT